ncbi:hypothetical protein BDZ45DRAFT_745935 [Acephala macrosclerotiorum]|nr:hypothetical protein BDZ45DRAFT_745935 [Acephala macrosclerotiorum]
MILPTSESLSWRSITVILARWRCIESFFEALIQKRKTRRVGDPYAIDTSDEDEGLFTSAGVGKPKPVEEDGRAWLAFSDHSGSNDSYPFPILPDSMPVLAALTGSV